MLDVRTSPSVYTYRISSVFFIIGILLYIYNLIMEYKDPQPRSPARTVWIWGFLVLLLIGYLACNICKK